MGVNLRDLFPQHPVPHGWYHGKRIAVDGHNVAFRYLTSLRSRDGDVLRSRDGRVIAHLIGFLNLVRHLRQEGAEPIVVWDGKVHPRKWATVEERIAKRVEAALNAEEALAAGDVAAHQKFLRATTTIDGGMITDCSRLLEAVGVAVVRAEHDAERHATALCHAGYADAVATEDFDALVAGAPVVLRKAGAAEPFLLHLSDLATHGLSQEQLRHIAILCGTDWHPGVKGFGAKTAAKMLRTTDVRSALRAAADGTGTERHHVLLRSAGMTLAEFDELDAFIAHLPAPQAPPRAPKPDPGMAVAVAEEMGIGRDRVVAAFC